MGAAKLRAAPALAEPTLEDARAAVRTAEVALREAQAAVQGAVDAFPAPMNNRSLIESEHLGSPGYVDLRGPSNHDTRGDMILARFAKFRAAAAAEREAGRVLDEAKAIEAPLQYAADMAALGDGREMLVTAIEAERQARQASDANFAAFRASDERIYEVAEPLNRLRDELAKASQQAADYMTASLLGEAGEAPKTATQIRDEIREVEELVEAAQTARRTLSERISRLQAAIPSRQSDVRRAVRHVVKVHPETRKLMERFAALNLEWRRLHGVVRTLDDRDMLPDGYALQDFDPLRFEDSLAATWSDAIERLTTDGAATLPETP